MKEVQEPDVLSVREEFPSLSLQATSDSVEINVLLPNNIDFPVSLEFEKPSHGSIVRGAGNTRFFYKANPGFLGVDTVRYRICKETACRPGSVLVRILPDPAACYPFYQAADTAEINLIAGPGRKSAALFPGDAYCPGNVREISGFSSSLRNPSVSDSVRFSNSFSRSQKRTFFISYTNTDQRMGRKTRNLKIRMLPDLDYCDTYFSVENREDPLILERSDTLNLKKSSLSSLVHACDDDLDPDFFQMESTPNLGIINIGGGNYRIYFKPMGFRGPAKIFYRFRNLRGVSDQGEMRILIYQKRN